MKIIKIFLASSIIHFHTERLEIADCIRALNDRYVDKGLYFKLFICEDESDAISLERKQDEYDAEVVHSDYFYLLVSDSMGEFTREEFDCALTQFKENGAPKIFTYFYQTGEGSDFCTEFMTRLDDELGHYYSVFSNIDSIKLHILMELISNPEVADKAKVEFKNGVARVDDVPLIMLDQVPSYQRNKLLQDYKKQLIELNIEFAKLAAEYGMNPQNMQLLNELSECAKKRGEIEAAIFELEKCLFDLLSITCDRNRERTWRIDRAIEEIENGNYEGAINILRDASRIQELSSARDQLAMAEKLTNNALKAILGYIEENIMRIRAIRLMPMKDESYTEICELFEETTDLIIQYNIGKEYLADYLYFLLSHEGYKQAVECAQNYLASNLELEDYERAIIMDCKARALMALNHLDEAKSDLESALSFIDKEVQTILYIDVVADLGNVEFALNKYNKAEEYFQLAYSMMREMNIDDREIVDKLFDICSNLGALYSDVNKRVEAEAYYMRAIGLMANISDLSLSERKQLAIIYNNLAVLYVQKNEMKKADEYIELAIGEIVQGEKMDPMEFLSCRVMVTMNQSMIAFNEERCEDALTMIEEASRMRSILINIDQELYEPLTINLLHNRGVLLMLLGYQNQGIECLEQAYQMEFRMTKEQSEIFEAFQVITRNTQFALDSSDECSHIHMLDDGVYNAMQLVEKLSPAYGSYVGMAWYNYGVIAFREGETEQAIKCFENAMKSYEDLKSIVGEKNEETSYTDIVEDVKKALLIARGQSDETMPDVWYMQIFEISCGQICGIAIRRRK